MKLSEGERLVLATQLLVLEKLQSSKAKKWRAARRAVEGGYVSEYEGVFEDIGIALYDEVPEERCRLVIDVFNMYRAIKSYNARLSSTERLPDQRVHFPGFDEHVEEDLLRYARFLTKIRGGYRELTWRGSIGNGPVCAMVSYERMLRRWDELGRESNLTRAQIEELLALGPRQ